MAPGVQPEELPVHTVGQFRVPGGLHIRGEDHHHHHADDVFDSIGFETSRKFTQDGIKAALEALDENSKYGTILRAKGIVAGEDGQWIHFDYVPGESDIRTGAADVTGKLCVIGAEVNKDAVKELFGL